MKEIVKNVMATVFKVDLKDIEEISQHTIKKWDSLNHLNLMIALESEFGVSLEPEEIGAMVDIETVCRIIEEKRAE
ncbi:MAG: acyl carrier protein [bacterium]|nr:acyl carrier protein [bacterium]